MVLLFPNLLTIGFSNSILGLCSKARNSSEEEIIFDLSKVTFITPFGITLLAGTISECLRNGKRVKYQKPTDRKERNFLDKIGFNDFFHLNSENLHFEISDTTVRLKRLLLQTGTEPLYIEQIIDVFGRDLKLSQGVKNSLKLSLNETIGNVFDHSDSQEGCFVCAQSYKNARNIKVCITDFGKGIFETLTQVPAYKSEIGDSHHKAIRLAVQDRVTSKPGRNVGLGLSHILRFLKVNEGEITIISGEGKVKWEFSKKTATSRKIKDQKMPSPFQGTIVDMKINYDNEALYIILQEETERDIDIWESL